MSATDPRLELLVGADAFWSRARADIAAARRRVLVQAMTFEADAAGLAVAGAVEAATAIDRRVLVDDYSRHVINDTMLPLPFRPGSVRAEARATLGMFGRLIGRGVGVRITNPVLGNALRYPLRNHKKLILADDVAYVGGINFSDHNFAWHDLMLRIEGAGAADFLAADFARDWDGRPQGGAQAFGALEIVTLDGVSNAARMQPLLDLVAGARRSVVLLSAYPTMPFVDALAAAGRRGAAVEVLSPAGTNKPIVRDYLAATCAGAGVRLRLTRGMTHAKALLVDGEALLVGSSNFNFASHRTSNDIVAIVRDPALIADFEARVLAPLRLGAVEPAASSVPLWRRWRARAALNLADAALARLRHAPVRAIDWPAGGARGRG